MVVSRRPEGLTSLLADDVEFHSPVMFAPQKGKPGSERYLTAAFDVLFNDSFRYVREIIGEHDAALEFELELDDVHINGVDLIAWNQDNQITSFKVMIRPRKALETVRSHMAQRLAAPN